MKLFNTGKRAIAGINPKEAGSFDKKKGEALLKMYPSELSSSAIGGSGSSTKALKAETKAIKAELATALAKVTELEATAETSLETIGELEADLEEATKVEDAPEATTAPTA